jgi:hypothetical protein
MGRACRTYGNKLKCIQRSRWEDRKKRDRLEDPGTDAKIIVKWISKGGWERVE